MVTFFSIIEFLEDVGWTYGGIPMLLILGIYLSWKSNWFQIRQMGPILNIFTRFIRLKTDHEHRGVNPLHAFFVSLGGCVGVGNLIGVCTAIQVGGPGAIFWMWVTALIGMLIKYSEIYLGIKFRIQDKGESYFGGPMVYLKKVPGGSILAPLSAALLCIYGIEIYIFRVITASVSEGWNIHPHIVIPTLLFLVLGMGQGGVRLVGKLSSFVVPLFLTAYTSISAYIFIVNFDKVPAVVYSIFSHAFHPHAAIGAFAGSTLMMTMSHGIKRACYTGDIGIGYAATIHAESQELVPQRQAALGIIDILLDTFLMCTCTVFLILTTGTWNQGISENFLVAESLSPYIPHIHKIWPFIVFMLGYSTILAFFSAGRKSAMFLFPRYGANGFVVVAGITFLVCSFIGTLSQCMSIMALVGVSLLMINVYGLFSLRNEINFDVRGTEKLKDV